MITEQDNQTIQKYVSNCRSAIKKEEIQLSKQKQYQIILKDTIAHIANVIYNQATQEQLKEYKDIDIRVQDVMGSIENVIQDIMQVEEGLGNIQTLLKNIKSNENEKFACMQILLLQNELTAKQEAIEKTIKENKTSSIIQELNNISTQIKVDKNSVDEIENEEKISINAVQPTVQLDTKAINSTDNEDTNNLEEINNTLQPKNPNNTSKNIEIIRKILDDLQLGNPNKIEVENSDVLQIEPTNSKIEDNVKINKEVLQSNPETKTELNIENANNKNLQNVTEEKDTNVLIISEKTGRVYLPYSKSDINYYMKCGFDSESEIINRFYTLPLKQYSNFAKARVRERI